MPKQFRPQGNEDPMATLCRMVVETTYDDLSAEVIQYAKQSILDTIGVMVGGSAMEGIPPVVKYVQDQGGQPESHIICYKGKVPASEAGLAMGPMARAMDFGQIHPQALHCSEHTMPALLAAAGLKDKVNGKDFITAFTLGQEVGIRVGIAFKPLIGKTIPTPIGSGHYIFCPVAAVGKLLGLDQEIMENAAGIARVMTQPHDRSAFYPPTHMVKVHHGFIAQDSINACLLAQKGITGSRNEILAGSRGYLNFFKWETDPDSITLDLGKSWEMLNVEVKPYSGNKFVHSAMYGIMKQMKESQFSADDIEHVHITLPSLGWHLIATPEIRELKWNPQTFYDCQYSPPFLIATAAYDQDVFLTSFEPKLRNRENIRAFMQRITASEDKNLPAGGSTVETKLKTGAIVRGEYFYKDLKGHPTKRFSDEELITRFKRCVPYAAYKLNESAVDSVIEAICNLEQVTDVVEDIIAPLSVR